MLKDMDFYHLQENMKSNHSIKPNGDKNVKQEPVEEMTIPTEKRDEILYKLRKVLL